MQQNRLDFIMGQGDRATGGTIVGCGNLETRYDPAFAVANCELGYRQRTGSVKALQHPPTVKDA